MLIFTKVYIFLLMETYYDKIIDINCYFCFLIILLFITEKTSKYNRENTI